MRKITTFLLLFIAFSCSTNNEIRGISLKAPLSENIDNFLKFTSKVLAPDGVNTIIFNIGWNYEFKSFPELTGPDALSESDIKKIVKHCKSLGIEIIPKVSMLGHQSTLIRDNKGIAVETKMHPLLENYPEFDENPEVILPEIYEWPNKDGLYFAIATYITFQSAKAVLLRKLNTIQSIGSFLRTKNGYKVTNPEGYVAIQKGGAVKLVDRLEFSRANFNMAKDWVKG